VARSAELGAYFLDLVRDMAASHPVVGDVRGLGLLVGVELITDPETKAGFPTSFKVVDRMTEKFRRRGLLLGMLSPQILQMAPPLCVTRDEIDQIVAGVGSALSELETELDSGCLTGRPF
jgi:4-aminobutyrate aminotransferase-like enzyme